MYALNGCTPWCVNYIKKSAQKESIARHITTLSFHPLISFLSVWLLPFTGYLSPVGRMFLVPRELS